MDPSSSSSSSPDTTILTPPETTQIPSFGIEFFEYRRRLFLAGQPLPVIPTNPPSNYTISLPLPEPIPPVPFRPNPSSAVGRLEALLSEEGAEETEAAWKVIEVVHQKLMDRKRLAKPLRLGLVIKILKAGWIIDGTWPIDPKTKQAVEPPESPVAGSDMILPTEITRIEGRKASADTRLVIEEDLTGEDMAGEDDLLIKGNLWRGGNLDISMRSTVQPRDLG